MTTCSNYISLINFIATLRHPQTCFQHASKRALWQLFYENGTKFQKDQTHNQAWCLRCLQDYKQQLGKSDAVAVSIRDMATARTEEDTHSQSE